MPSKFLAKNPPKILSENRLTSYIAATCNFLISVLFPCQHGTHSAIDRVLEYQRHRQSTKVPEYHFVISFYLQVHHFLYYILLCIIIYNIIIYTYKLLLSSCHFSKSQMVLWYSMVTLSVQSGLRFNYVEFGTIKIRIHQPFPYSKELNGIAIAQPVREEEYRQVAILKR